MDVAGSPCPAGPGLLPGSPLFRTLSCGLPIALSDAHRLTSLRPDSSTDLLPCEDLPRMSPPPDARGRLPRARAPLFAAFPATPPPAPTTSRRPLPASRRIRDPASCGLLQPPRLHASTRPPWPPRVSCGPRSLRAASAASRGPRSLRGFPRPLASRATTRAPLPRMHGRSISSADSRGSRGRCTATDGSHRSCSPGHLSRRSRPSPVVPSTSPPDDHLPDINVSPKGTPVSHAYLGALIPIVGHLVPFGYQPWTDLSREDGEGEGESG